MSWNRKYHFFLFFGDTVGEHAPWHRKTWKEQVQPALDNLFKQSTYYKKIGVGSMLYTPKAGTSYFERVKTGKILWNDSGHDKWTVTTETPIRFHHLDIWVPSRGVSEKLDAAPDIYFSICNERDAYHLSTTEFEWFAVLAVATDVPGDVLSLVASLSAALHAKKTVYTERGWQEKVDNGQWHFINAIQDTMSYGIYKADAGSLHKIPFHEILFAPYWKTI